MYVQECVYHYTKYVCVCIFVTFTYIIIYIVENLFSSTEVRAIYRISRCTYCTACEDVVQTSQTPQRPIKKFVYKWVSKIVKF